MKSRRGAARWSAIGSLLAMAILTSLTGCAQQPTPPAPSSAQPVRKPVTAIRVFAAIPLKPAFTALAGQFQADNPGVTIDFDFATSAELADKLTEGAQADVFASADAAQMDTVVKADLNSSEPVDFATNTLVIVTAPGNPDHIGSFADLTRDGIRVAVCQASAPCGVGVQHIEDITGNQLRPVREETIGSAVLARVTAGDVDAGLVYLNDAHTAGDAVEAVRFPESADAVNAYPIVVLRRAAQSALAQRFVDLVTGPAGRRALTEAGFAGP